MPRNAKRYLFPDEQQSKDEDSGLKTNRKSRKGSRRTCVRCRQRAVWLSGLKFTRSAGRGMSGIEYRQPTVASASSGGWRDTCHHFPRRVHDLNRTRR
jgi:hypothetical protein